jgi:hypothetical protein
MAGAGEGLGEDGLPEALGVLLGLLPQAPCLPHPAHQLLNPRHDAALLGEGREGDEDGTQFFFCDRIECRARSGLAKFLFY